MFVVFCFGATGGFLVLVLGGFLCSRKSERPMSCNLTGFGFFFCPKTPSSSVLIFPFFHPFQFSSSLSMYFLFPFSFSIFLFIVSVFKLYVFPNAFLKPPFFEIQVTFNVWTCFCFGLFFLLFVKHLFFVQLRGCNIFWQPLFQNCQKWVFFGLPVLPFVGCISQETLFLEIWGARNHLGPEPNFYFVYFLVRETFDSPVICRKNNIWKNWTRAQLSKWQILGQSLTSKRAHTHIYIYIYMYMRCGVIIWAIFGHFNGY